MSVPFRVLHVCTGNIGRSPMAELLMRHRLQQRLGAEATAFVVESAGTWGREGLPMEPYAGLALRERGLDADGFASRALTVERVAAADLVLTATVAHRGAVVGLLPAAVHRTFTWRELARIGATVDPAPLADARAAGPAEGSRAGVRAALAMRGAAPRPPDPADDDVADPLGEPLAFYLARATEIERAIDGTLDLLLGSRH